MEVAIKIRNLNKKFIFSHDKTLKGKILNFNKEREFYWALKDISLDIFKGEVLGIVGRNGSGKSTILKVISNILFPTSGEIKKNGKVSSLLELGAGFDPEFTGIENIYLKGSILGFTKKELDKNLDKIINFSELGEFVYQPVKKYSSGMYMRLGFSLTTVLTPEILIIDEILSVGDQKFREKCINRLQELKKNGVTIIIVAHSHQFLKNFCDRIVWMDNGEIRKVGDPTEVTDLYLKEKKVALK